MASSKGLGLESSPSSEQTQLGDKCRVGSTERSGGEGAGGSRNTHGAAPRCPPGEISRADAAQLEEAQRETSSVSLVFGRAQTAPQPPRSSRASPVPESAAAQHNLTLHGKDVKQIFVLVTHGLRHASTAPRKSIPQPGLAEGALAGEEAGAHGATSTSPCVPRAPAVMGLWSSFTEQHPPHDEPLIRAWAITFSIVITTGNVLGGSAGATRKGEEQRKCFLVGITPYVPTNGFGGVRDGQGYKEIPH